MQTSNVTVFNSELDSDFTNLKLDSRNWDFLCTVPSPAFTGKLF